MGLINFKGVDANIPGKSVILADARDDIGVALTPAKGNFLPKIDLNNPVDYTKVFSGTAPNYDFSFYATPFAISKSVAKGKYTARLIIDVTYQ